MARVVRALALISMFLGACAGECLKEAEGQCLDFFSQEAASAHGQQTALLQVKSTVGELKMQSNSTLGSHAQEAREGQSPDKDEEESKASNEKEDEEADSTNEKKTKKSSSANDKANNEEENSANDRKAKKKSKSANEEENSANDRKTRKSDSADEEEEDSTNDRRSKRSNSANEEEDSSNDRRTKRSNSANEEEDSSRSAKSGNEDYVDNANAGGEKKSSGEKESKVLQGAAIAPFGKEDTARELQHHASRTQDTLVDAIENAEVAEIKRSIFRSLTRLRAAEIKEFDTIARLETQAIDEYNDNHHYRAENPLDYIHSAETKVKEDKYTSFHD